LQAVIGDDAVDATQADGEIGLAKFLSDHFWRSVRVQEEIAQDLAHGLVGAPVIRSGPGLLRLKSREAPCLVGLQQLVITLAAESIMLGDQEDVAFQALALQQHEKAMSLFIGGGDVQSACGAADLVSLGIKLEGSRHGEKSKRGKAKCLIEYGTTPRFLFC
jgi:hypothetical protein